MKIGFVGQGWIGKNYANDFEARGYDVTRYSLETEYIGNKDKIKDCDIVFIAVPTPTTPEGFDYSAVLSALTLVGKGKTAVIKSTLLPGTTEKIQEEVKDVFVLCSPEFLVEKTAAFDAANPNRNIIGIPKEIDEYREKANDVLSVLPNAPYNVVIRSRDAEFVKYAGNCYLFTKVIFMNIFYDLVTEMGGDWDKVREAFIHDPRIGESHTSPVHSSGRGAGGHCFIKDFEAFRMLYDTLVKDSYGSNVMEALAEKNIQLLKDSNKDIDLLTGVYGDLNNRGKKS
jgi:UDPglucose 6-dehydrogenase